MLDISLLQMKYAIEVFKAGSISQAAKNLYMNQPNLSRAIKELESALGIVIFIRTPKGVILSKEGKIFLEYAEEIFQKLDKLEETLQDQKTNNVEAVDNLLHQGFELGILRYTQPYEIEFQQSLLRKNLLSREIWESEYVLLMSNTHPLAKAKEIRLEALEEYTELVHGDENYHKINPLGASSKRIALYERGSQFDLLRNVPSTYMWVSPIPADILESNDLIQRKCVNSGVCFRDVLIWRAEYQFSQFASQFIETLQQVKEDICNGKETI